MSAPVQQRLRLLQQRASEHDHARGAVADLVVLRLAQLDLLTVRLRGQGSAQGSGSGQGYASGQGEGQGEGQGSGLERDQQLADLVLHHHLLEDR